MRFLKTTSILLVFLAASCNTNKATTDATSEQTSTKKEMSMDAKAMLEKGFKMGTIVESKAEGDCPFVIQVEGDEKPYFLDPVNLEAGFKKNGEKIWFTFAGLRMMNRCEKANPVNILEIQKREE